MFTEAQNTTIVSTHLVLILFLLQQVRIRTRLWLPAKLWYASSSPVSQLVEWGENTSSELWRRGFPIWKDWKGQQTKSSANKQKRRPAVAHRAGQINRVKSGKHLKHFWQLSNSHHPICCLNLTFLLCFFVVLQWVRVSRATGIRRVGGVDAPIVVSLA